MTIGLIYTRGGCWKANAVGGRKTCPAENAGEGEGSFWATRMDCDTAEGPRGFCGARGPLRGQTTALTGMTLHRAMLGGKMH